MIIDLMISSLFKKALLTVGFLVCLSFFSGGMFAQDLPIDQQKFIFFPHPMNNLLPDLAKDYKPLFHFLSVRREAAQLHVASIRLTPDFKGFEEGKSFTISKLR